ncbi:lactate utilization protein B [Sulfobacillus thermosulfidooxidans]|uniref:lactate utilization protein B n=1 Tax=Sulfobacillus thermosulfidooxidans TaxID=28034 RepID=UPI0006B5114D|nr:lactate utilization protein B [Sulfobacillus thermosulfidooxidans]
MAGELPYDVRPWAERRDQALNDQIMRKTIGRVTRRFSAAKREAYRKNPDIEASRERATWHKRKAIHELPELIDILRQRIEDHGGNTYLAATAREAVEKVVKIAQEEHVSLVIKSKSMVTEEIALNPALEAAGITVRETDLGEYIIQLAHEKPSHILAPAAHRNRQQIDALFQEDARMHHIRPPVSDGIADLTHYARERLRQEFLQAEMGVTGGNFLVAETGTLVIITNEGNADMVTSLPRVLVSIVGVEKIVEDWASLIDLIQQPAMSGIGRHLSSYTTMVHGPKQQGMADGPEKWYVILVDNGRMALRDTPFEEVLTCIRCGACLNVCPVFRQVGGHAYGSVYPGPIGIVETPLLTDLTILPELPSSLCTLCHACEEACPMEINLPKHIVTLRQIKVKRQMNKGIQDWTMRTWARFWMTPKGYHRSIRIARLGQKWYQKPGQASLHNAPGIFGGWFETRDMPPVAAETFHEWWKNHQPSTTKGLPNP